MQSNIKIYPGQHIHLVGIGGFGLSAIARVLLGQGCRVSGSDRKGNTLTDALAQDGAIIYEGHNARYIDGADMLIFSSAVPNDHVEIAAARAKAIPVYKRSEIIAALMEGKFVIAVAGTHGKTTTTAMIVHILRECGLDPSYIVGGIMRNTGTNAGIGKGQYFVIEADEYDNMFHGLHPDSAVITNIEYDHPDFFESPHTLRASFDKFVKNVEGMVFTCADDPIASQIADAHHAARNTVYTYGFSEAANFRVSNVRTDSEAHTAFDLSLGKEFNIPLRIQVPGLHNVLNAAGAFIVAQAIIGPPFECSIAALETFEGTGRRFDLRGEVADVAVIDDYAHHPTAIKATLQAARQRYPNRDIWAVWQPHTYSRTQALMDEYIAAFGDADHVLITDIYAAREDPIPGVTGAAVVATMTHPDLRHTPKLNDAVEVLHRHVQAPAAIIIMSAGDAPQIGIDYLKQRREKFEAGNEVTRPAQ